MSKRKSSGREPFIYRAHHPTELQGVHTDLIASALKLGENPLYMFYSPLWEGEGCCFGISSAPASHAIAVAKERFIISRDLHIESNPPSLHVIPFNQILSVEMGKALLLGWLSILFAEEGGESRLSILFKTTGMEHYEAAIREYRAIVAGIHRPSPPGSRAPEAEFKGRVPIPQARKMQSMLLDKEQILHTIQSPRIWGRMKRRWKTEQVCIAGESVFVVTNIGFLFAADETDMLPDLMSYGVNVWSIPRDAVRSASVIEQTERQIKVRYLRLNLRRESVSTSLDVPFENSCAGTALTISRQLTWRGAR